MKKAIFAIALALGSAAIAVAQQAPRPPPVMAHGVTQCGEVVALWILLVEADGLVHAYRTDAFHHPDTAAEYDAFLAWVRTTPKERLDLFELPCKK